VADWKTGTESAWDGTVQSYRPSPDWRDRIASSVVLSSQSNDDIDPITFEVIRHRLWTINIAHGEMVVRISGSPVFQALDFNMCILTEDAEVVMNAPYLQYLDSGAPLAIPYILEHLSADPGVYEGDVFVCNDPWIGAVHQMDVFFGMPVFVDGELFAWVSNAGHQYDLGGIGAGGWPEGAVDVFSDPVVMPPFKLVERGHMRPDLEAAYLRHSRSPGLVALDLRAQLAGCRFAAAQLQEVCQEFGAGLVKGTMRRILAGAQDAFRKKLERIPDGRWSEVLYFGEKLPGERHCQRVQLNFEKVGDRIVVDNKGTDPQAEGPNGLTYASLTGTVLGAFTLIMLQDHLFAVGGATRQVSFEPEPGLLTCVNHPAAVSGGVNNVIALLNASIALVGRMLACDPEQQGDAVVPGCEVGLPVLTGSTESGRHFGSALIEQPGGCGATSWRDGVDTGGFVFAPLLRYPNAEQNEQFYPILVLWRRQLVDSAGAGEHRGGGGIEMGFMPYRAERLAMSTNTGAIANSGYAAPGLMGAYPVPTVEYQLAQHTNIHTLLAEGHPPRAIEDVEAQTVKVLPGKSTQNVISEDDVVTIRFPGGGGYGDPLERSPEAVWKDIEEGWVSIESAECIYGVTLDVDGALDLSGTETLRQKLKTQRTQWSMVDEQSLARAFKIDLTTELPRIHAALVVADGPEGKVVCCGKCGMRLSEYGESYRRGARLSEVALTELPLVRDPSYYLDDELVFRRYCCPSCGILLSSVIVRSDEGHEAEMQLTP
jgi:N-methylhydantoinase B